jgi:hypothetical protein
MALLRERENIQRLKAAVQIALHDLDKCDEAASKRLNSLREASTLVR